MNLEHLKALAEKATPGPWLAESSDPSFPDLCKRKTWIKDVVKYDGCGSHEALWNNGCMEYVLAANPQTILKLLSIIEIQREALKRIAKNGGCTAGMGYTNAQCAREALTTVDGILDNVSAMAEKNNELDDY